MFGINKRIIIGSIAGFFAVIILLSSFTIVSEGNRGLLFTFGSVSQKVLPPGIAFKIPFIQSIKEYTIRPISTETTIPVGPQGAITKDNQTIGANMSLYYRYKEPEIVRMYSAFGEEKIRSILENIVMESFKTVIGSYDIFSLPMNQDKIGNKVVELINGKIKTYPIELTELKITNYDWSDEFDAQITATMNRAQKVKQAEQDLLVTEQEAQKKVKQAEAEKNALITTAEGEKQAAITKAEGEKASAALKAEAKILEGEGIKKYNQALQANADIELKFRQLEIELVKAKQWNGQNVPTNNYGPIPFQNGGMQGVQVK